MVGPVKFIFFQVLLLLSLGATQSIQAKRILVIGDSLTEGLGVAREEAYPALVEKKLKEDNNTTQIINAGVSGATSASGLRVLRFHLKKKPDILILALGANDGLRGFLPTVTQKNLSAIIDLALRENIKVIVTGVRAPPNYGKKYEKDFAAIFTNLAKDKPTITLVPFLLEGVAGEKGLNQPDGIHPNPKGHRKIAETILKYLKPLL